MRDPYHDRICTATDAMVIVTTNAQLYQEKWDPTSIVFNATLNYGESAMRSNVVGFVAAAALLTSVGIANAGSPVKLTDGQLDNITAGSAFAAANVATTGALNFAGAVNTAVGANLAAMASPSAVGTAVTADLAAAGAFNNLLAASTSAAIIAGKP